MFSFLPGVFGLGRVTNFLKMIRLFSPGMQSVVLDCRLNKVAMIYLKSLNAAVAEVEMFDVWRLRCWEVGSSKHTWLEVVTVDIELKRETRQRAGNWVETASWTVDNATERVTEARVWAVSSVTGHSSLSAHQLLQPVQQHCSQPRSADVITRPWRHH